MLCGNGAKGEFRLGSGFKKLGVQTIPEWTLLSDSKIGPKLGGWFLKLGGILS